MHQPIRRRAPLLTLAVLSLVGVTSCRQADSDKSATTPAGETEQPAMTVVDLQCEGQTSPIAVTAKPRLSWRLEAAGQRGVQQTAWQVLVASKAELLEPGKADLWDSQKTASQRSPLHAYAGEALEAGQICHWKVRVWDHQQQASPWSETATFEVAPTKPADWHGAQWIDDGKANPEQDEDFYKDDPAPLMRREFKIGGTSEVARARLHVAGLGLCYPSLNGERLDDHLFEPAWTHFNKRVLYRTHDVTGQLESGTNCIGLELGNGWYNPLPLRMWGHRNIRTSLSVGRPRAIACLVIDYKDGSQSVVTTDGEWKTTPGPTLRNSIYLGEHRDARRTIRAWNEPGLDESGWKPVKVTGHELDVLKPLAMRPVRELERLQAIALTSPEPGTHIVDFGVNHTGLPELKLDVPAGTRITLRYGELLHEDGSLNPMTSVCGQIKGTKTLEDGSTMSKGGPGAPAYAWQEDVYIARGGGETYRPDFTFHAYRFMEVKGLPAAPKKKDFTAIVFNSELPQAGKFLCSEPLLNRIQEVCLRTFHANVITVQSDCPHRERFGYGGDIVATSETFLMNFDMQGFYAKTARDWGDAALPDGLMPDTAPFVGVKYCGVGWGMAHPLLVEQLHQHYGDIELVREQLPIAVRWIEAEAARLENDLVTVGLGDHESLVRPNRSEEIRTPVFIDNARRIARLARIAGDQQAAARCDALADKSRDAWVKAHLDPTKGMRPDAAQTELSFALGFGAVPAESQARVFEQLVADLNKTEDSPRLTTGIYGTWQLLELLPKYGRNDLAHGLATRESFPSWGWMLRHDATTLWEHWEGSDNTFSNNHPMFGSVSGWMFRWLGGIQCAPDAVGFDKVLISPLPVKELEWVESSHESIRGTIVSNWRHTQNGIEHHIVIPPDTTALITLPKGGETTITESGKTLEESSGISNIQRHATRTTFQLGSGNYRFSIE